MKSSETIGKLAEALSKAQGVIEGASKDGNNPFFKSHYSTLAAVWDVIRKPLSDNGLAIIQTGLPSEPDTVSIETTLVHSSGEWVSGIMSAKLAKVDCQSLGSAVSYLRRYSISALCGVYSEDDDAEAATQRKEPQKPTSHEKQVKKEEASKEDVPMDLEELDKFKALSLGDKFAELTRLCDLKGYIPKKAIETMTPGAEMPKFYNYLINLKDKEVK